jgi:predicted aspartyl protease
MAATRGRLDSQGCPLVTVAISPEGNPSQAREFDGLIDTGFTGFAQMPLSTADSLVLVVTGTLDLTYSDGSTQGMPVAWATLRLGTESQDGFILLSDRSDEILLGVHFLRLFRKTLLFSVEASRVELE